MDAFIPLLTTLTTLGGNTHHMAGALLGGAYFLLIERALESHAAKWTIYFLCVLFAIYSTEVAANSLGTADPSIIVLDEFVAVPFVFVGYPRAWRLRDWVFAPLGLLAFIVLDWMKWLGIAYLGALPGGLGIVSDDLAAALCVAAALYLLRKLWPLADGVE